MAGASRHRGEKAPGKREEPVGRLGGVRPLAHDPDERPSGEDRQGQRSPFDIPVPLPRFLKPRGRHKNRG